MLPREGWMTSLGGKDRENEADAVKSFFAGDRSDGTPAGFYLAASVLPPHSISKALRAAGCPCAAALRNQSTASA